MTFANVLCSLVAREERDTDEEKIEKHTDGTFDVGNQVERKTNYEKKKKRTKRAKIAKRQKGRCKKTGEKIRCNKTGEKEEIKPKIPVIYTKREKNCHGTNTSENKLPRTHSGGEKLQRYNEKFQVTESPHFVVFYMNVVKFIKQGVDP
ncbi:hypothetical protein POVCU2_0012590 [Plasmodium ovale curtisi]|uniref:Uncharacterized protein n=1 Tax=Plasmodium ovale curtisi TaxID=864141 RepID=A0A1A8VRD9_PLAOA|nr:hypothetical protein POVCU2_0012590 [Plasmodium ovale curtisi]SBS84870.1 hypothetical protein POVCU1_011610 [Plasmodium ovale curtisi]